MSNVIFIFLFHLSFLTLNAWAASTMNQSDIRGLAFRPEPTLILFVASFAFYGHEFCSSEINISYRVVASSFIVPTLLSIIIPKLNHKTTSWKADEKKSSCTIHFFSCLILRNCKPYKARQFSGYGDINFAWHLAFINQMPMSFS